MTNAQQVDRSVGELYKVGVYIAGDSWRFLDHDAYKFFPLVYTWGQMTFTMLLTGFGPFPSAPYNPTGPLVAELARLRHPAFAGIRRIAHVFRTSYDTVDRELPELLKREQPDAVIMFGLAQRSRQLRIETCARNELTRAVPDAGGKRPAESAIVPGAPGQLPLRAPAQRLLAAARAAGTPAVLSRNAGRYLCNYLCWRASEACLGASKPRLVAFVHVPQVGSMKASRTRLRRPPFALDDLVRAGEAIMLAALAAARAAR